MDKPVYFLVLLMLTCIQSLNAQTLQPHDNPKSCITEIGLIKVDPCNHSFSFPAKIHMDKGLIEVAICIPQGKNHESIFVTEVDPVSFEAALNLIGCIKTAPYGKKIKKPEEVLKIKHRKNKPDRVEIQVEYKDSLEVTHLCRMEDYIWDENAKKTLAPVLWHFKGIPVDEKGNPVTYMGNNLVVTFVETDAILEMDSPMLFDDNYLFANQFRKELFTNKNVIIHIKLIK